MLPNNANEILIRNILLVAVIRKLRTVVYRLSELLLETDRKAINRNFGSQNCRWLGRREKCVAME